ncbi:hypothetical protein FOZ61_007877 [Perkinsus olseni]|uniref:Uncharacterized protein n=1 Tax=Perkinsus olseni TaxID=32597 RepID=A0A7J6MHF1_PEROL|nr:hypothetical protein FOZ61_007877 [Perkinsus olseni]KAF4675302.1 hypothetical protein FOL46_002240 [Perkinsus olseni]
MCVCDRELALVNHSSWLLAGAGKEARTSPLVECIFEIDFPLMASSRGDRREESPTRTSPGFSRITASPFDRGALSKQPGSAAPLVPNKQISETPESAAAEGKGLVATVDIKAVPENEFPMVPSVHPLPAHIHQHYLKPGRHSSLLPNSSHVNENNFIGEDGTLLRSAVSSLPTRVTICVQPSTAGHHGPADGANNEDSTPGLDLSFLDASGDEVARKRTPFFFPFPHDSSLLNRFPPSSIQSCEVRIKRLEKLATRLHRKEQYFDGLHAAARMSMMPSGLCNRVPFRIGPFDRDPHSGEPPVATDSWPPFARYDSEGLLGMYGRELRPYIVKKAITTSTSYPVTLERISAAAAMDEKAPTPVEPAVLSSGIRRCESLPAFYKVAFILRPELGPASQQAVLTPQNMQANVRLMRRPRQMANDVPMQPRIPVTWTHHSKLSESLHLWNPHEEKRCLSWRGSLRFVFSVTGRGALARFLGGEPRLQCLRVLREEYPERRLKNQIICQINSHDVTELKLS